MSNMSYCRFRNTYNDLADCTGAFEDLISPGGEVEALSREELAAAKKLVDECMTILNMVAEAGGIDLDDDGGMSALEQNYELILDRINSDAHSEIASQRNT